MQDSRIGPSRSFAVALVEPSSASGTTATVPTVPGPSPATTAPVATTPAKTTSTPVRTSTAPPVLESKPEELRKRSRERAQQAVSGGARKCPNLTKPSSVVDITAEKVSLRDGREGRFATTPKARRGLACDIIGESFTGDPQVQYACRRKADKATINYTAVG